MIRLFFGDPHHSYSDAIEVFLLDKDMFADEEYIKAPDFKKKIILKGELYDRYFTSETDDTEKYQIPSE